MPRETKKNVDGTTRVQQTGQIVATETYIVSPKGFPPEELKEQKRNLKAHLFTCPRDEWIYGPETTQTALAAKWGLKLQTVSKWVREEGWVELRKEYWARVPVTMGGGSETKDLALLKEKFIEQEWADLERVRVITMDRLEDKIEEQVSPTGDIKKIKKRSTTHKEEVKTLHENQDRMRLVLGMATKPGAFAGANVQVNQVQVVQINRSGRTARPTPPDTALPVPSLPDPADTANIVEAEFSENSS